MNRDRRAETRTRLALALTRIAVLGPAATVRNVHSQSARGLLDRGYVELVAGVYRLTPTGERERQLVVLALGGKPAPMAIRQERFPW